MKPYVIKISEAGLGLRRGEVRGLSDENGEAMTKRGTARPLTADEIKKGLTHVEFDGEGKEARKHFANDKAE